MQVHFIGMGKMGLPMAQHLAAAGQALSVSDTAKSQTMVAEQRGLKAIDASGLADALACADVVMSSLPDDAALLAVTKQVSASVRPGTIFIDTSTVSIDASKVAAELCDSAKVDYLRSTVSGNNKMAEAAQLTVMVSGARAAYDIATPLFKCLGPNVFYLGQGEQARLMKLVVNLMIAQTSAMLAEGLTLGQKGGLDWRDMWQVLGASAVGSPILKAKSVQLSERDFTPTFTVAQMAKDLDLILQAGANHNVPLPQAAMTRQLMHAAIAQGDAQDDYAAIIKAVERSAGVSFGSLP